MCGRFSSTLSAEFIRRLFGTDGDLPNLGTSWNLAPSQDALVVSMLHLRDHHHGRNHDMSQLHDRMPLVLDEPDWRLWLGEEAGNAAELLRPAPDGSCEGRARSTDANQKAARGNRRH